MPSGAGMHALAEVMLPSNAAPDSVVNCFDDGGTAMPYRIVHRDEDVLWVLMGLGVSPTSRYQIYFGSNQGGGTPRAGLVDPVPVGVALYGSNAQGIPNTWEKMRFMAGAKSAPIKVFRQHAFGAVEDAGKLRHRGRHGRHSRLPIVRLSTCIRCPESGPYRLAVDSRDVAYLLIDGELVAARTVEGHAGEWLVGAPVYLEAGVHELEVYHKTKGAPFVRVGWQPPGGEGIGRIPHDVLLSATRVDEARLDRRDDAVYARAAFDIGRAYAFRDCPEVFVPVTFTAEAGPGDASVTYRWDFGDGSTGAGERVTHVYKDAAIYDAVLSACTEGNPVPQSTRMRVDGRLVRTRYYAFAPRVTGLPAVCYEDDSVSPVFTIDGIPMRNVALDVRWTVTEQDGRYSHQQSVEVKAATQRLPIITANAEELERIAWSVSHRGVPIRQGTVWFERPPFARTPTIVEGDRLRDAAGDRLVLVAFGSAGAFSQPPITLDRVFGELTCVDDSLAVSSMFGDVYSATFFRRLAKLLNGPGRPVVSHHVLPDWSDAADAYGPLMRLIDAPRAVDGADAVVLTVGRPDITWEIAPAEFERQIAALIDLLAVTHGYPVILATPPPFRGATETVRLYAAAIQRVAQARRLPVADLYSAFMNTGDERAALFVDNSDFMLSGRGHYLAARVIARAILMQAEGAR